MKIQCIKTGISWGSGGGVQNRKPSMGGVWIFSGTAHCLFQSSKMAFVHHHIPDIINVIRMVSHLIRYLLASFPNSNFLQLVAKEQV